MPYVYKRNENGDYVCEHCGKVVPKENPSTMHYHLMRHDNNLPFACKVCDFKGQFQRSLDLHMAAKHPDSEQAKKKKCIKCPNNGCTFETLTRGNAIIHYLRKHCRVEVDALLEENGQSKIVCKQCSSEFQSSTAFHYHCGSCLSLKDPIKRRQLQTLKTAN